MKVFLVVFCLFCLLSAPCHGVDVNELFYNEIGANDIMHSIPDDIQSLFDGYEYYSGQGLYEFFKNLQDYVLRNIQAEFREVWKLAGQTLMIVLVCGFIAPLFLNSKHELSVMIVGGTTIAYNCLGESKSCLMYCIDIIEKMYDFSTVLLPCLAGASVAAGASVSGGVKYTAAALFMNIYLNFSRSFLVPLICSFLVCEMGNSIFPQPILKLVSKLLKWLCITVLSSSVILFTTYISVAGLITGSGEKLATQIAKTTLSNGLPVVGRIVSDAASTLVAGAIAVRNGIGLLGMLVVISMFILPLLGLGIRYFIFRLIGTCSELYPDDRFKTLIHGVADAYGMLFAVIGTGFITLFFTLLSFLQILGG